MEFNLSSPLLDYDPEEEERKRTAALAALAAQAMPEHEAFSPGELDTTSTLTAPTRQVELPQIDIVATPEGVQRSDDLVSEFGADEPVATAALAEAGKPAAPPAPTPPPVAPPDAPPPPAQPDPFEALMLRGEAQRREALDLYGKNEPGVNGWAILADVAFNKGKSIPNILQQVDNDKRAWRDGRAKLLTGGHSDPVNQAIALGNLQARQATGARLTGKEAAKTAQSEQNRAAFLAQLKNMGAPQSELDALANADEATFRSFMPSFRERYKITDPGMLDGAEELARKREHGRTTGGIQATHENIGTKAHDAGEVAGAQAAAQAPHLANRPLTPDQVADNAARDRAFEETKRAREAAEGTRADAAKARKDEQDRNWTTDYGNKHLKQIDTAKLVDELDDIISSAPDGRPPGLGIEQVKEGGVKKYPLGQTGRAIAAVVGSPEYNDYQTKADYNRKLLTRLGESVYRIDTGASGNEREEMRAAIASATSPLATLDDIRNTLKILRTRLSSQLGNAAAAAPELAARSLSGGGIAEPGRWIRLPSAQPMTAADPELGPGQSLTTNEEGDEVVEGAYADPRDATPSLGTTSKLPKAPDVSGSMKRYTVTLPSGRTKKGVPLSEHEVEMYRLKGIRVE